MIDFFLGCIYLCHFNFVYGGRFKTSDIPKILLLSLFVLIAICKIFIIACPLLYLFNLNVLSSFVFSFLLERYLVKSFILSKRILLKWRYLLICIGTPFQFISPLFQYDFICFNVQSFYCCSKGTCLYSYTFIMYVT